MHRPNPTCFVSLNPFRRLNVLALAALLGLFVPPVVGAASDKDKPTPARLGTIKNDKNDSKSSTKDRDGTSKDRDNGKGNDKNADNQDHIDHDWNGVGWGHENYQGNGYGHQNCDDDTGGGGGGGGGGPVLVPVDVSNTTGSVLSVPLQGTILLTANLNAGSQPVTYQWMWRNSLGAFVAVPGATSLSLSIPSATSANDGEYWIEATNSLGSASSTVTTVVVTSSLAVLNTTGSQINILPGGSGILTARLISGTEPVTYQWMQRVGSLDPVVVPGATSLTYTISNATAANAGQYYIVATNDSGSVASTETQVNVSYGHE
jgi:hypothetical protein